jgi:hypothetical protein
VISIFTESAMKKLQNYKHMTPVDRRRFDFWLHSNIIAGFLLFTALVAIALAGSQQPRPTAVRTSPGMYDTAIAQYGPNGE